MMESKTVSRQPFWVDDLNPYRSVGTTQPKIIGFTTILVSIYRIFGYLFFLSLFIVLALQFPIFWVFVLFEIAIVGAIIYFARLGQSRAEKIVAIQRLAKEVTGASYIGSAIHTAGHPLLQVNQPVVLALKDSELSIYGYDSSTPIDTLSVNDLKAVNPVGFDDDYIPHVGVIDNTAQALQISFQRQNIDCICSFRRMYKVRPIEWYHAIQKARLAQEAG